MPLNIGVLSENKKATAAKGLKRAISLLSVAAILSFFNQSLWAQDWDIPVLPPGIKTHEQNATNLAEIAWQEFRALNWPVHQNGFMRDQVNKNQTFGARAPSTQISDPITHQPLPTKRPYTPVRWETWKQDWELFQNGAKPSDWDSYDVIHPPCDMIVDPEQKDPILITRNNWKEKYLYYGGTLLNEINQAGDVDGKPAGPLIDRNSNYIHYEIRVNRPYYDFIKDNNYYLQKNLPKYFTVNFDKDILTQLNANKIPEQLIDKISDSDNYSNDHDADFFAVKTYIENEIWLINTRDDNNGNEKKYAVMNNIILDHTSINRQLVIFSLDYLSTRKATTSILASLHNNKVPAALNLGEELNLGQQSQDLFKVIHPNAGSGPVWIIQSPDLSLHKRYYVVIDDGSDLHVYVRGKIHLPASDKKQVGAIEVKAAWQEFDTEDADLKSRKQRYYHKKVLILHHVPMPEHNRLVLKAVCQVQEMLLIGLHIGQKLESFPGEQKWLWATFEHQANAPDPVTSMTLNGSKGYSYTPAAIKFLGQPHELVFPQKSPEPVHVVRLKAMRDYIQTVNDQFKRNPEKTGNPWLKDHVWKHYVLIAIQWPQNSGRNIQFVPQDYVANAAIETYVQQDSCMSCHSRAATTDFSWVLKEKAWRKGSLPELKF